MALTKTELEQQYRTLEAPLYNFALRWVFNSALAEELVHEAFVRVWNRQDEVEVSTIKSFLYKTVQNLALNEIRRRRVREILPVLNWLREPLSGEESLLEDEKFRAMQVALEKLPHDLREVLLLSHFSDMSYAEIAQTLRIPEGTVASRKNRALGLMRNWIGETNGMG